MNRAYSVLDIKSIDGEQRIVMGVATTPTPDRMGDIVEPLGVQFKNPMPLLWQHRTDSPVGQVVFDKPTAKGINFTAQMPIVHEPGTLKDRVDEAWQSVKLGLVRAVSIGFRSIEHAFLKETDGIRFIKSEVLELSLVTIPAQADATIQAIKAFDAPYLTKDNSLNSAGVTFGNSAISSGSVNKSGAWSFSAEDGNALLGANGDDWSNYGKHFLGIDASADAKTKAHWKYPFAKAGTVYRSGLIAVRQRADQQGDTSIFDAAGRMIDKIDGKSAAIVGKQMYGGDMGDMMPYPAADEKQSDFMTRCVQHMLNCGDGMTQAEASAHCAVNWDNRATDAIQRAATGQKLKGERPKPPGATGKVNIKSVAPKGRKDTMTTLEQIAAFEASRAAKAARMTEIMQKASDAGETLDQEASDEYDTLDVEVKKVDEHLVRLRNLEASNKRAAVAVEKVDTFQKASEVRGSIGSNPIISVKANVPPEMPFVRYCIAHMRSAKYRTSPEHEARKEKSWHNTPEVELALSMDVPAILKSTIGVGTTTDATWGSPMIAYTQMASLFAEYLRPLTIIGRIPGLRRVPFNIQIPRATSGTTVGWVGENAPKPVSAMAFDTVTLRWAKAAGIVLLTDELIKFSSPAAETVVRDDITKQMVQFLDKQFVDPSVAAVTNVSPASITNGVSAVVPTGTTASAFRADAKTLFGNFMTANIPTAGGVWIMTQQQALALSLMQNSLGQPVFPTMTPEGGTLLGYPVVASQNLPSTTGSPVEGYPIIFAVAPEIMVADDGVTVIDSSNEASVQLDTAPDSPPSASTAYVSLWQMNFTGLRAERWITWVKRRTAAVQYIQSGLYSE
jgi:HK97 family phage major capsid protein/HK97 family phage prohead protease